MIPADLVTAIDKCLEAKPQDNFAIFDFDNTCVIGDIGELTLAYLVQNKLIASDTQEKYDSQYAKGDIAGAYMLNARMFKGFTTERARALTTATIEEAGKSLSVNTVVIELMTDLREKGVKVWILSASNEIAVRVAMDNFGIHAECIGVRDRLKDGIFQGNLETPMPILEGKVDCLRKYIDPKENPLLVIDDSPNGLAILQTGAIKVVVNKNPTFVADVKKRGWFIL